VAVPVFKDKESVLLLFIMSKDAHKAMTAMPRTVYTIFLRESVDPEVFKRGARSSSNYAYYSIKFKFYFKIEDPKLPLGFQMIRSNIGFGI